MTHNRNFIVCSLGMTLFVLPACIARGAESLPLPTARTADEIAVDAYLYAYPLLVMDAKRRTFTVPVSVSGVGPVNTFNHMRNFPNTLFRSVVRPNFDTLYSSAWVDLTKEPVVVSVPATGDRYYILQMMDMWTDVFASPSKRTDGNEAYQFALTPPGWQGALPEGLKKIDAPTPHVWIIARTYTAGDQDLESARQIQNGYRITTLSKFTEQPPASSNEEVKKESTVSSPPRAGVDDLSASVYFRYAAELLKINPPHAIDAPILKQMQSIGFVAGKDFDLGAAEPDVRAAFEKAPEAAQKRMREERATISPVVNGWQLNNQGMGVYGDNYLKRAIVTKTALGANIPEDAVYPMTSVDANGESLVGDRNYIIVFPKDGLPPVNAFWSITLYNDNGFPEGNSLDRYSLSARDALKYNDDGSLTLYIQHEKPDEQTISNWLPAPKKNFNLTMRLYWPKQPVLDGTWAPPPVQRK